MKTSKALLGIIAGVAVGAIIGVLMAPESGENTRKKIVSKSRGAVDDLKSKFNSLVDGIATQTEELAQSTNNIADKVRKTTV